MMLLPTLISMSYADSTTRDFKRLGETSTAVVFTSNCMYPRRRGQSDSGCQRLQTQQSSPALQQHYLGGQCTRGPYSSPLPQTQWSDVPSPYRPRGWREPEDELFLSDRTEPSSAWCLQPPMPPRVAQAPQGPSSQGKRRRPRGFRNLITRNQNESSEQHVDASLLHPQMNVHHDRRSTYSAPDELEHYHVRSIGPPNTSNQFERSMRYDDLSMLTIPRSPTYPPAGRGRMHSVTGVGEAAFDDEEEFRLFAEATAGLGPEQPSFRHSQLAPSHRSQWRPQQDRPHLHRTATMGDLHSPAGDTPTTMYALHCLAQLPEGSPHSNRERLQASTSGLDLWLEPPRIEPRRAVTDLEDLSPTEDFDDELPDYAESQAQAQAYQRAEAARRAEELQRRWQLSGARRGL